MLQHLRVPAVSRLQKIHNVDVALQRLNACGIPLQDIGSRDIVDGHRAKTLAMIWKIIAAAELTRIISLETLTKEIEQLKKLNWASKITTKSDALLSQQVRSRFLQGL